MAQRDDGGGGRAGRRRAAKVGIGAGRGLGVGAAAAASLSLAVAWCADRLDRLLDADRGRSVAAGRRTQRGRAGLLGAGCEQLAVDAAGAARRSPGRLIRPALAAVHRPVPTSLCSPSCSRGSPPPGRCRLYCCWPSLSRWAHASQCSCPPGGPACRSWCRGHNCGRRPGSIWLASTCPVPSGRRWPGWSSPTWAASRWSSP